MFEPKRLHPIAAFLNAFKQLKELIVPIVFLILFGSKGTNWDFFYLIASVGAVFLFLISGILSWLRYTYRIEEGELRIEYGVFVRKKRYIPFERIQSLDLSEGLFHRPFGLVKVTVETAGSSDLRKAEAVLTAVKKHEAAAIQEFLQNVKKGKGNEEVIALTEAKEDILYKISPSELLILASTSGGVGVVLSAVAAFLSQFQELIPFERIFKGLSQFVSNGLLIVTFVVFIGFLLAWLIAVIGMMFKYADFTLKKVDEDLIITRGLLEKRQTTIPLKRIQAIRISENLIRQPLKFATVMIESAGGSGANAETSTVTILPVIKKERIRGMLEPYISDYLLTDDFVPAPKRAVRRYVFRGLLFVIPPIIVLIIIFKLWGLLSLVILPFSILWSYLKYKDAGWRMEHHQLNLRYRTIVKHSIFMRKNKIQSLSSQQSFLQRKKDLSTIQATVKSGAGGAGGKVVDIEEQDASSIYAWYSRTDSF